MKKSEEILRKEITTFEWSNDGKLSKMIPYDDALKAVEKALILYDVRNLVCNKCNTTPLNWIEDNKKYLKCECGEFKQTCC
jgi:hypothetical protein